MHGETTHPMDSVTLWIAALVARCSSYARERVGCKCVWWCAGRYRTASEAAGESVSAAATGESVSSASAHTRCSQRYTP